MKKPPSEPGGCIKELRAKKPLTNVHANIITQSHDKNGELSGSGGGFFKGFNGFEDFVDMSRDFQSAPFFFQ